MTLTPPRDWNTIKQVFLAALERPREAREAFIAEACGADDGLRGEVVSLLAAYDDGEEFLGTMPFPDAAAAIEAALEDSRSGVAPLATGTRIGQYELLALIGSGGMADVYRARDTKLDRIVALKIVHESVSARNDRVLREARAASALNHPNICTLFEAGEFEGQPYLATEYVDGQSLDSMIPPAGMDSGDVQRFGVQIAEALAHAHAHGVVHRDLKCANIAVTAEGRAKVLDFGVAKRVVAPGSGGNTSGTLSEAGKITGTVAYMAPELLQGKGADARSDIWAMGVLLYELAAGRRPFTGDSFELTSAIMKDPPPPLPARVPGDLRAIILGCLSRDPDHRYQRAADLAAALRACRPKSGFGVFRRISHRRAVAALAAAAALAASALVAIGLAVYLRIGQTDRPSGSGELSVKAVPLTSYEGAQRAPSLSPDGSQVAFSWNGLAQDNQDIYVKLVGPGEPIRLTTDPARDDLPAWSPDGLSIAFLRWASGNDSDVAVIVMPALGNAAERRIATVRIRPTERALNRLCWTPDGKWLAIAASVAPDERDGIWLISPDTRARRRLIETPGPEAGSAGDFSPAFSSDGRRLAFAREESTGVNAIYVLPLSPDMNPAGTAEAVTDASQRSSYFRGLAWSPDDSSLVFSSSNYGGLTRLYRLRLTPDRRRAAERSHVLPFGEQANNVTVSSQTGRMVYVVGSYDINLWRLNLTEPSGAPVRSGIRSSTFDELTPSYSRDSRRIAFTSTRTGSQEMWVANVDGSDLRQVTFIGGALCENPQWSPTRDDIILFNSQLSGSNDLYLLDLSNLRYHRMTTDPDEEIEARWSRDGKWIYFGSNRTGRFEIWKMPADGGAAVQITEGGGIASIEGRDGFLYYAKALVPLPTSIWRKPIAGGNETLVLDGLSFSSNFAVGEGGLYFISQGASVNDTSIEYFDVFAGRRTRLWAVGGKRWWRGVALSPDEKWFMYSVIDRSDSRLMVVDKPW